MLVSLGFLQLSSHPVYSLAALLNVAAFGQCSGKARLTYRACLPAQTWSVRLSDLQPSSSCFFLSCFLFLRCRCWYDVLHGAYLFYFCKALVLRGVKSDGGCVGCSVAAFLLQGVFFSSCFLELFVGLEWYVSTAVFLFQTLAVAIALLLRGCPGFLDVSRAKSVVGRLPG